MRSRPPPPHSSGRAGTPRHPPSGSRSGLAPVGEGPSAGTARCLSQPGIPGVVLGSPSPAGGPSRRQKASAHSTQACIFPSTAPPATLSCSCSRGGRSERAEGTACGCPPLTPPRRSLTSWGPRWRPPGRWWPARGLLFYTGLGQEGSGTAVRLRIPCPWEKQGPQCPSGIQASIPVRQKHCSRPLPRLLDRAQRWHLQPGRHPLYSHMWSRGPDWHSALPGAAPVGPSSTEGALSLSPTPGNTCSLPTDAC